MDERLHISYSTEPKNPQLNRVWIIPEEFKERIVKLLGGHSDQPNSIAIRPGYLTQTQATIPLTEILNTLGGSSIEIPSGKGIRYKMALRKGFKYILEKINGAWMFTRIEDNILRGYTHERINPITQEVVSIGKYRKIDGESHQSGPRYLIKYPNEKEMWDDYVEVVTFERNHESYQNSCNEMDNFDKGVF